MRTEKSFSQTTEKARENAKWFVVDGEGQTVGRIATKIATLLRGKGKPDYTPNVDCGDHVVVVNCEKVVFKGNKWETKKYNWHTGYIGGIKERTAAQQLERKPETILFKAVKGMLPANNLSHKQMTRLRLFVGDQHSHQAQEPVKIDL